MKCNREGDHTGLHSNGQYDWGPGDVLDAQARMVWGCPTCGEESFDPDTKEVTGGLKITCPDCGADIFQPDAGWPGPPSET